MTRALSFLSTLMLALACTAWGGCSSKLPGCTTDADCSESTTDAFCDAPSGECLQGIHCDIPSDCTAASSTCDYALAVCTIVLPCQTPGHCPGCQSSSDCPSGSRCDISPDNGSPGTGICVQVQCEETGFLCEKASQCCSDVCNAGKCG